MSKKKEVLPKNSGYNASSWKVLPHIIKGARGELTHLQQKMIIKSFLKYE